MADTDSRSTDFLKGRRPRRRVVTRRKSWDKGDTPIDIRVGNRRANNRYSQIQATSSKDDGLFQRMLTDSLRQNPKDPLLM